MEDTGPIRIYAISENDAAWLVHSVYPNPGIIAKQLASEAEALMVASTVAEENRPAQVVQIDGKGRIHIRARFEHA
jgi:hypothetical protein